MKSKYMRAYSDIWMDKPTFKLMSVDNNCPFLEGIYLPEEKKLILITKEKVHRFDYIPKLDANGDPQFMKQDPRFKTSEPLYKRERVQYEKNYDYTLTNKDEIVRFLMNYAKDDDKFNFNKFLE